MKAGTFAATEKLPTHTRSFKTRLNDCVKDWKNTEGRSTMKENIAHVTFY